jgi:predicted transcriptional regulator
MSLIIQSRQDRAEFAQLIGRWIASGVGSIGQLADKAGVSRCYVKSMIKGHVVPHVNLSHRLLRAMGEIERNYIRDQRGMAA